MSAGVVVVTGGASGIGAALCAGFAADGQSVAICDVNAGTAGTLAESLRAEGYAAQSWVMDVTEASAVERVAVEVERDLGAITTWINNAGISRVAPFLECSDETWETTLRVNLTGAFHGCRAALRRMHPRRRGCIINMSSQSGRQGSGQYAAYCASKFGLIGLTQSLAVEFAKEGIRVNAICPGVVFTPLWEGMAADYGRKRGLRPEEVKPFLEGRIPMGRLCRPEEVAAVALFLASDAASYITGQSINLTGGTLMT